MTCVDKQIGVWQQSVSVQWGNLATVAYLVFTPYNARIGALVYALADGPLAAALIAWQSAWVFGSTEHSIRCLMVPVVTSCMAF